MQVVDLNTLLAEIPPYTKVQCSGFLDAKTVDFQSGQISIGHRNQPDSLISTSLTPNLFCEGGNCQNDRYFVLLTSSEVKLKIGKAGIYRLDYMCRNCRGTVKSYFLKISPLTETYANNDTVFTIEKVGQFPRYGQRLPRKTDKLLGDEKALFLKGTTNENQGMGIGAFTYYRRVLDSQKNRIFDEIIKVLRLTSTNEGLIKEIEAAKTENQFTKAVGKISTALPDGLNVQGHNPLTLLYSALSEGLHNHTDEECLELAHSIKLVLFEFSERLDSALKEDDKLSAAVKRLIAKR